MTWTFTEDPEAYAAAALPLLESDPAELTVALTALAQARAAGPRPGTLFGWWSDDGRVTGAVGWTPPFPIDLARVPDDALSPLLDHLAAARPRPTMLSGPLGATVCAAALWTTRYGQRATLHGVQRLHRLTTLVPPPDPGGRARTATSGDVDLVAGWLAGFSLETASVATDPQVWAAERIADGAVTLWLDPADRPVSMAARNRIIGGMARIGPVWTPVEDRRRGYAAAATAAATRAVLDAGVGTVVLFTDLANPTSNAIYRRLGFTPVGDRTGFVLADPQRP